ncbi:hypothetical protein Nmel_000511, partial [Mimus melanotis]
MEDSFIVLDNHESRSDTCFLGILDGCHGVTATETIVAKLPLLFLEQLSYIDSSYKNKNNKEQILEFFCHSNQGRLQGKREKPGNEETSKTSLVMKVYHESIFTAGRNEVSKVHCSGCSVAKIIPSKEMDGTGEEERKRPENNTHSQLARTAKGVAGLLYIAIIGKYIPHQIFFPFIQLKKKKRKKKTRETCTQKGLDFTLSCSQIVPHSQEIKIPKQYSKNGRGKTTENLAVKPENNSMMDILLPVKTARDYHHWVPNHHHSLKDTKMYPSTCKSQAAEETQSAQRYCNATSHLVNNRQRLHQLQ